MTKDSNCDANLVSFFYSCFLNFLKQNACKAKKIISCQGAEIQKQQASKSFLLTLPNSVVITGQISANGLFVIFFFCNF
jgi:hypothetical protein